MRANVAANIRQVGQQKSGKQDNLYQANNAINIRQVGQPISGKQYYQYQAIKATHIKASRATNIRQVI